MQRRECRGILKALKKVRRWLLRGVHFILETDANVTGFATQWSWNRRPQSTTHEVDCLDTPIRFRS